MTLHKMRLLFLTFFVLLCTCSALGEGEVILEDDPASEEEVTLIEEEFETPDLQLGDTGDGVSQLQRRLTELYYYSGNISGNFGESTQAAVKAFQEDFGLEATGVVDADTQALLYSTEYRPLQYGSSGDDVKELQTRLNKLGFECGAADGIFGKKTLAGVKAFQLAHNLTVDGKFGSASFAALNGSSTEQTYTTVQGDTLWKISKKFLGKGSRYKKIMTANGMTSTLIRPGMELKIPV